MQAYDVDLFVIGGGSGGVRAARVAAGHGARVAIAEGANFGGTCVNRGCVPKKLLVYASRFGDQFRASEAYGWDPVEARFNWRELIDRKDREIHRLEGLYKDGLEKAGVAIHPERAEIVDEHTVQLRASGRRVTAGIILIATGGQPHRPDFPGNELAITSDEAFHLEALPRRILVFGGGYIAVELAGAFAGMGSEVTHFIRGSQVLRGFDSDVSHLLMEHYERRGIRLLREQGIERIRVGGQSVTCVDGMIRC